MIPILLFFKLPIFTLSSLTMAKQLYYYKLKSKHIPTIGHSNVYIVRTLCYNSFLIINRFNKCHMVSEVTQNEMAAYENLCCRVSPLNLKSGRISSDILNDSI